MVHSKGDKDKEWVNWKTWGFKCVSKDEKLAVW